MKNRLLFNRLLQDLLHPEKITLEDAENNRLQLPVNYLWTSRGVFVLHNYTGREVLSIELESGLITHSKNDFIYVPKEKLSFDYKSSEELREDSLMIATFGDSGARTLSEIAKNFSQKPYIFGHEIGENHPSILSSLALDIPFVSQGLVVHANAYVNSDGYRINKFKPEIFISE